MEGPEQMAATSSAALLPAAGLLVFALSCGTFAGGATAWGAVTAHAILWLAAGVGLAIAAWRGGEVERIGGLGVSIWAPVLAGVALAGVALPWWASPVPRAGRTALVLVPIFLILPWLVARCWRSEASGQVRALRGSFGIGLVVVAVSARALWGWLRLGTDGASLPLGHHNLLAAFLVTTLPLAALGWNGRGVYRWTSVVSVALGVAALLATRSLAGAMALAAVVVMWGLSLRSRAPGSHSRSPGRRSLAWALLVAAVTVIGLGLVFGRRILSVVVGVDPSSLARLGYWKAGFYGFLERPWLGWGPGSTAWTVHHHFRPVPGVHPQDQILADLHSLPLQLLYELGVVGCALLCLALGVAWWRLRRATVAHHGLVWAGRAGLVGFAVVSLGGLPLSVLAVPLAASVGGGAWLAGTSREQCGSRHQGTSIQIPLGILYLLAAAFILQSQDRAHLAYDQAMQTDVYAERVVLLQRVVHLDPHFPLYRWRLGLETGDAESFGVAARSAAIAPLWITAEGWDAACRLSRLGAVAPFRASQLTDDPGVTARAILAQPWLMAAVEWRGREDVVDRAVALLIDDPRVEIGWRAGLRDSWAATRTIRSEVTSVRRLVLEVDDEPATSLSLHAFRRSPWPARVAEIRLDVARFVPLAELPPATQLPTTDPSLFRSADCSLGL